MSFAITRFKAYATRTDGDTRKHVAQVALMTITAANTDVALDISSLTAGSLGTFWTAVIADTTYGTLGAAALAVMQAIKNIAVGVYAPSGEVINYSFSLVTSGASGAQYTRTVTGHMPSLTFVSGSAPTLQTLRIEWDITDGTEAILADLGAAS